MMIEREQFPRFSIGESLLPQSMAYLEQADMLRAVQQAEFQLKDGAAFTRDGQFTEFDFSDKHSAGWCTTYQVERARFDQLLALEAARQGATVRHGHEIVAVDMSGPRPRATVKNSSGGEYLVEAEFILDASGFGRVLPRLLQLESPSTFPVRASIFTHVEDRIGASEFDRNKILIAVHPKHRDVWYWLIPFTSGRASVGAVAEVSFFSRSPASLAYDLQALVGAEPRLSGLLRKARWDTPVRRITGYAANVKSLHGRGFALLGNAGEFLDPIFSSGVTIAFKSASLAVDLLHRQLAGEAVDWQSEFASPLKAGIDAFRAFVESWYRGGFQRIIFHANPPREMRRMITSILAGYAWDTSNPFVRDTERRLAALEELCYER
jgi:flavin-dependent dehydrogenase